MLVDVINASFMTYILHLNTYTKSDPSSGDVNLQGTSLLVCSVMIHYTSMESTRVF